jgi:uroporphyrinogen decarboxylase
MTLSEVSVVWTKQKKKSTKILSFIRCMMYNGKHIIIGRSYMNARERVFTALERKEPDMVPVLEFVIDPKVAQKADPEAKDTNDFRVRNGMDAVGCSAYFKVLGEENGYVIDEWGVKYKENAEIVKHPVTGPIKTFEDLKKYKPMEPDAEHRFAELKETVKKYKGEMAITFHHRAAFMWSAYLMGLDYLLMSLYVDPDLVEAVMDMVLEINIAIVRRAIREGAEVILLGDDYATNTGPLMSPVMFRQFILPRLQKMVDAVHEEGAYAVKHSDGNLMPIIDMILGTGIDAINPIEPAAGMDIKEIKEKYGASYCIIGNIDCGELLSNKNPEDVELAVKNCIRDAGDGGGYICATSNSVHSSVKPENLLAMINATKKYGKYPLQV